MVMMSLYKNKRVPIQNICLWNSSPLPQTVLCWKVCLQISSICFCLFLNVNVNLLHFLLKHNPDQFMLKKKKNNISSHLHFWDQSYFRFHLSEFRLHGEGSESLVRCPSLLLHRHTVDQCGTYGHELRGMKDPYSVPSPSAPHVFITFCLLGSYEYFHIVHRLTQQKWNVQKQKFMIDMMK